MKNYLVNKGCPLHDLKRIYKRKGMKVLLTLYLLASFTTDQRPADLIIGPINFPVNDFYPTPIQCLLCFKCQLFDNTSVNCKGRTKCMYWSESHPLTDCGKQSMKCANCDSTVHTASYGGCPSLKKANAIEYIARNHSMSYQEAKKIYHNQTGGCKHQTVFSLCC